MSVPCSVAASGILLAERGGVRVAICKAGAQDLPCSMSRAGNPMGITWREGVGLRGGGVVGAAAADVRIAHVDQIVRENVLYIFLSKSKTQRFACF